MNKINTKTNKKNKEVPSNREHLQNRIQFARENAEIGDVCSFLRDGVSVKNGFIVGLTTKRNGKCSHAKIYNPRNRNGDVGSGDLSIQTANWYPFKYKYGGIVLTGDSVTFDYNKAMYLSIA